ncbi:unnamed protein product [Thlaspi arvense]|uniref:GDSL esterase/lipase n=1 Tax=Thlaspi arvense TaxID=13288 RepID=A0AAU9T014_THLAR|nr:unnamed protein product [Thlaspi arvense]
MAGVSKALLILVATVLAAAVAPVARGQQAPCYFVFGDSVVDNGNNNALNTFVKVNYLPYGIDFPQGPTGRFSNGRNIPDFIAELMGFKNLIPPFAGASPTQANIGINYASGGGGIRQDTSNVLMALSLGSQINNHQSTIKNAAVPPSQLSRCLYTFNIGSNDYLNNYFLQPSSPTRGQYTPDQYASYLISLYHVSLEKMYSLGARNMALFGISRIGCTPRVVASLGGGVDCAEEVNQVVNIFNNKLKALVAEINSNLHGVKLTYVDLYSGNGLDLAALGLRSCCMVNPGQDLCAKGGSVCPDRTKYLYWDRVHTTETISGVVAKSAFDGVISSPFSISQLVN